MSVVEDAVTAAGTLTVGVAVVTYNSAALVDGFLDAVVASVPEGVRLRVVAADNASQDDTVARLERRAAHLGDRVELTVAPIGTNLGYAAGINVADHVLGHVDALLVANPDIRLDPGCLAALLRAAAAPGVGIVVPRLTDEQGHTQPSLRRDPSVVRATAEAVLGGRRAARIGCSEVVAVGDGYDRAADVEWATGALLLVTAACRERLGPWDESFFLYSEETEYLQRARRAGFRVRYEPAAIARHRGGAAHVDPGLWALLTCNRVVLFRRSHSWLRSLGFFAAVLLNELLRVPVGRPHRVAVTHLLRLGVGRGVRRPGRPTPSAPSAGDDRPTRQVEAGP